MCIRDREKALTALALVFAIFELNPAPFCILDEVDAPLDDLNTMRFINMVEEMSKTVQFIFITHNKVSMEKSDHLMGVTMQEAGVSRMVTVDVNQALEFAKSRENWIQSKLLNHVPEVILSYGSKILYKGQELIIQPSHNKNISISDKKIFISGPENLISGKIKGYLKTKARDHLDYSSRKYSKKLGKQFKKITLRDTKSRWGSCTSDGHLMYSWRLIMAPPEILDYVTAHEVAHLSYLNHSKEFWNTVAFLLPEFSDYQNWLKINGQLLQRYRF